MKTKIIILALLTSLALQAQYTRLNIFNHPVMGVETPSGVHFIEYYDSTEYMHVKIYNEKAVMYSEFDVKSNKVKSNFEFVAVYAPHYNVYVKDKIAFQIQFIDPEENDYRKNRTFIYDQDGNEIISTFASREMEIIDSIMLVPQNDKVYVSFLPGSIKPKPIINNITNNTYNCDCPTECDCETNPTLVQNEKSAAVTLYPNPSVDIINLSDSFYNTEIQVYSIDGVLIDHILNFSGNKLKVGRYGSGTYLMEIEGEQYKFVVK